MVDDELRVHGLDGLRVIDASIMPTMLSANLNAATLMIADKASDLIRGRTPPEPVVLAGWSATHGSHEHGRVPIARSAIAPKHAIHVRRSAQRTGASVQSG